MVDAATAGAQTSHKPLYFTAALSSVLLYCSYFPLNLGFLIWIALVPFLFLVRAQARPRHVYLSALFCGLLFFVAAVQWMRVAHPAMYATWLILAITSALYFPVGLCILRRFDRWGIPLSLSFPAVWVGLEYVRAHFPTGFTWLEPLGIQHRIGFAWYFLGHAQHEFLPMIQIADLTGAYGVSFVIALVNAVVFQWLSRLPRFGFTPGNRPWLGTALAGCLVTAVLYYGYQKLDHPPFRAGPRVALLQSNIPQSVKMTQASEMARHMLELLRQSVTVEPGNFPDLIVWPETSCDIDWCEPGADLDPANMSIEWQLKVAFSRDFARKMAGWRSNHLIGIHGFELAGDGTIWKYNSAVLTSADGKGGPRYDKMHLVPFGEYVPLRSTFPWMKMFTPYQGDYSCKPGERWTRFPLVTRSGNWTFGCIICYEDTDPALARQYAWTTSAGPPVDFLVNISNDGWFNGTEEHEQHLAICRFRAIETRKPIIRSVNMGISGIIDSDGRVVAILGPTWHDSKKVAGVVNDMVPLDDRSSFYAHWGDWLPALCWLIVFAGLVLTIAKPREIQP